MGRFFSRALGAVLFVLGSQATADIPMVTAPVILPPVFVMPELPAHAVQKFVGISKVSARNTVDAPDIIDVAPHKDISAFGMPCKVDVQLSAEDDAMIGLQILAPCQPHSAVHVSHGGLHYQAELSLTGHAELQIPAMKRVADVFVAVDETIFERRIEMPDVRHFARVALSAVEGVGPQLVATALSQQMDVYHSHGLQVFSVDVRSLDRAITYRLTLRHQITAQNCNRPVETYLRRISPGFEQQFQNLSLAAQDCSQIGKILELKNIVPDLKLARN